MSKLRNIITATALLVMASGSISNDLSAQECYTDAGGCGYEGSVCQPSLTPYIALGTVAIVAIIALAVRHHGHHHGHAHSHG